MKFNFVILTSISLVIASCAPSKDEEDKSGGAPPFGYEFALAKGDSDQATSPVLDLTPSDLTALASRHDIRLIDVRTQEEFDAGHLAGAELIAFDQFDPATLDQSDPREIVLYCRSGRRSRIAGEALANHTGVQSQHLVGGLIAWKEAGQPVELP